MSADNRQGLPALKTAGEASPAQIKAIEHASGPMQVLAGPGSGKTFLMIRRIRHLVCHHVISPDKILVITFAKAAALEMQERFFALTQGNYPSVSFGTFHAVYYHILKSGRRKENLIPISSKEKAEYLKHSLALHGIKDTDSDTTEKLLQEISRAKNNAAIGFNNAPLSKACPCVDDPISQYFPSILEEYCRMMEENQKLDFDDMILLCDKMLTHEPRLLSYWQSRFSHILVDEFQDIGPLQYRILQKLAAPENNLFVVGDDDQSIYGFRGAGPDIMRQFIKDYKTAKQISLEINYRCREKIVQASSLLIGDNRNRFSKSLRAGKEGGGEVKLCSFLSWEEEANYLIGEFRKMTESELGKTAVICRTNAQPGGFCKLLAQYGIPFRIHGKTKRLLEHPIAKDFLAYLQFAWDISNTSKQEGKRSDFFRIMNKPCRYLHRDAAGYENVPETALLQYYREIPYMQKKIQLLFADLRKIASLRPYLATDYIRKKIGYDSCLCGKTEGGMTWKEIADSIQETQRSFLSFEEWKGYAASCIEQGNPGKEAGTKEGGITFITMHSAKGLEYDNVFLPDVNGKIIPHSKAITPEQIEEERRLLYVAMTRAKERLEILCSGPPSFFLEKLKHSPFLMFHP